ncbi:hypothetical protein AB0M02_28100 [Actinoplanes sp. NPDC051861]|uniref:Pepco domain-containing protein n=1 Tax=Actinoplanes sp. NPDC051861 TaxID=3155170 RepID=UPI00342E2476
MAQPDGTVQFTWTEFEEVAGSKGLFDTARRKVEGAGLLDTTRLAANLQNFCRDIAVAVDSAAVAVGQYELDSLELNVEVTAKGEIRLIGSASSEVKGGLKLCFRRRAADD